MLRRTPTVLSITAEDVADYEDRRAEALEALQSLRNGHAHPINNSHGHPAAARLRSKPPAPNWAPYHRDPPPQAGPAGLRSDSDEYAAGARDVESDDDDEEEHREVPEGEGEGEEGEMQQPEESTMDVDLDGSSLALPLSSSPAAARAMGRGAGLVGRGHARGGGGGGGGGLGQGRGGATAGQSRSGGRGFVAQGQDRTAVPVGSLTAQTQIQGGRVVATGNVVTPETRPARSREERIGVAQAPERRRR